MSMRKFMNLLEGIADTVSDIGLGMETAAQDHADNGKESMELYYTFDDFTKAYFEAITFTEMHSDNPELEHATFQDFALKTMTKIKADCASFQHKVAEAGIDLDGACKRINEYSAEEQAGHDFWLTRNGHGAGFWDGDWIDEVEDTLTKISKSFGEVDVYLGDDEKVYMS